MSKDRLDQQVLGVVEGEHLDIVVTEVMDISRFWVNVRTTETLGAREKLMDCMDLFYNMEGQELDTDQVYPGSLVAAPYYKEGYHRAKVISVVQDTVGLNYIDFGTVGVVRQDQLRELPQMFRALPSQAIECRLWGVESVEARHGKATGRFMELVEKANSWGGFVAIVKSIDSVDGEKAGLWLVDTASNSLPDGKSVNYLLLEEELVTPTTGLGTISCTGQIEETFSSSSSSLLAAVDKELAACRYVQKVDMGGVVVHILNLMGEAWVTSQEISILVGDWQGRDILSPMLSRKKVELKSKTVSYNTHPDLMERMVEEGVEGASGEVAQIKLYRLVNIPGILNLFMVTKDRQRMAAVTAAVQEFDPSSQFWMIGNEGQ